MVPGRFSAAVDEAVKRFGFPRCYEDMTLYLRNESAIVKIVIKANLGIDLICRDNDKNILASLTLRSGDIKNLLQLLTPSFGAKGVISLSPVFEFGNGKEGRRVKLIKDSLIGPIVTFINCDETDLFDNSAEYIDTTKREDASVEEMLIDPKVGPMGSLNSKILSYLERNGIFLSRLGSPTYRDVLKSKSNDYGGYEEVFKLIMGHDLLSGRGVGGRIDLGSISLSVIIPAYNSENTIGKTLLSLQAQNNGVLSSNIEVVIVDDASKVPLSEIIDTSKFPFAVTIIRLNANMGASTARKIGTSVARGDILIYLDSDIVLSADYLREHMVRNMIIPNGVFVSLKENVRPDESILKEQSIVKGLPVPDYSKDLRVHKIVKKGAVGSYGVDKDEEVEILESTNYFKSFFGSRVFGIYDLSCMVISHNFSVRKQTIMAADPFSREFTGWGMEDVYLGLKLVCGGNFVIPVLSAGVYHIDHDPRSGSEEKKQKEYRENLRKIDRWLDSPITENNDDI